MFPPISQVSADTIDEFLTGTSGTFHLGTTASALAGIGATATAAVTEESTEEPPTSTTAAAAEEPAGTSTAKEVISNLRPQ